MAGVVAKRVTTSATRTRLSASGRHRPVDLPTYKGIECTAFRKILKLEGVVGSEIQQICLGRYDVQFLFSSGTRICVQSLVEVFEGEELVATWDEERNCTTTAFQKLMMVDSCAVLSKQTMEIRFQNGLQLRLHDNSTRYESLQIYPDFIVI